MPSIVEDKSRPDHAIALEAAPNRVPNNPAAVHSYNPPVVAEADTSFSESV
jgi:hypothetical protein